MTVDLDGFTRTIFSHEGTSKSVYTGGHGPAVIVIHEVPGITPRVADFGRRLVAQGYTAVMPSLFGTPGRPGSFPYMLKSMIGGCVSREFTTFSLAKTSPISTWLRALAKEAREQCGPPGVGVVGMCFTGGFALGMLAEPSVIAPALSQPSLPLPLGSLRKAALGVSDDDIAIARDRCAAEDLCVMGMRFSRDPWVPSARFRSLERELGDHFIAVEIDSGPGNSHKISKRAHSVLTQHLVDEPGHPTRDALDGLLKFFAQRLKPMGVSD